MPLRVNRRNLQVTSTLDVNSDLIAFAQLTFAYSTQAVNGVPGSRVPPRSFTLPPPRGPEGTFAP